MISEGAESASGEPWKGAWSATHPTTVFPQSPGAWSNASSVSSPPLLCETITIFLSVLRRNSRIAAALCSTLSDVSNAWDAADRFFVGDSLRVEVAHLGVEGDEAAGLDWELDPWQGVGDGVSHRDVDVVVQRQVDVHIERARGVLERGIDLVLEIATQLSVELRHEPTDEEHFLPLR